ncbi:hypothetical protein Trydic_g21232 [Trypoxylus dichotomus]
MKSGAPLQSALAPMLLTIHIGNIPRPKDQVFNAIYVKVTTHPDTPRSQPNSRMRICTTVATLRTFSSEGGLRQFLDRLNRKFFENTISSNSPAIQTAITQKISERTTHRRATEYLRMFSTTQATSANSIYFGIKRYLEQVSKSRMKTCNTYEMRTRGLQHIPRKEEETRRGRT